MIKRWREVGGIYPTKTRRQYGIKFIKSFLGMLYSRPYVIFFEFMNFKILIIKYLSYPQTYGAVMTLIF